MHLVSQLAYCFCIALATAAWLGGLVLLTYALANHHLERRQETPEQRARHDPQ